MARTRGEIKTLVKAHTGWTDRTDKDSVIESFCNSALKYAIMEHDFQDVITTTSGESDVTTGATSIDLSSYSPAVFKIITARLIKSSSSSDEYLKLYLRDRQWWDKHVVDPDSHSQGTPTDAFFDGDTLHLNRPCEPGWIVRLRYSSIKTYTDDSTETPSEYLDLFVEYKVTADLFLDLENIEKYRFWEARAIGLDSKYPGGELARAIRADEREAARRREVMPPGSGTLRGLTTKDLNWTAADEHDQYRSWF